MHRFYKRGKKIEKSTCIARRLFFMRLCCGPDTESGLDTETNVSRKRQHSCVFYHRRQRSAGVCGQNIEDAEGVVASTISPATNWILTI